MCHPVLIFDLAGEAAAGRPPELWQGRGGGGRGWRRAGDPGGAVGDRAELDAGEQCFQ